MTVTGGQANGPGGNCANACGGGIYVTGGVPQLRHLALISNHATSGGGGLYGGPSSGLIVASSFRGNQAGEGGGAFLQDGRYQVVNTLFSGNFAGGNGGGLHAVNTPVRMVNVTAAGNRAGGSGGGLVLSSGSSLNNTVLGGNTAGSAAGNALDSNAQISGNGVTVQNSLVQNGCGQGVNCSSAVLFGDPQFAQLADPALAPNSLGDYRLQPQSAAIDRGVNDAGFDPSLPEGATIQAIVADLAEGPRIVAALALPPRIDLGAYEAPNSPPVFMTPAATQAGINAPYVYDAVAEDPNHPGVRLAVEVVVKPQWLAFGMQASGAGRLQGTPGEKEFGSYNIILRATDSLGAVGDQSFMLKVKFRLNPVFLPAVLNQR
jgi:hypothetical protein